MKKEINKKKIVKYAGAGLLATYLLTFGGMHLYDSHIDHLNEYCPLNNVLGLQHQVHKINNEYSVYGINAFYAENGEAQLVSAPMKTKINGKVVEMTPIGYGLSNGKIVKNIKINDGEDVIAVTRGTAIYPEGAQPGDLIKKSDIQVYNPQVFKIITDNNEVETIDEDTLSAQKHSR